MIWACILGYVAVGASFYVYITRTAQIEPDIEADMLTQSPTLTMIQGAVSRIRQSEKPLKLSLN